MSLIQEKIAQSVGILNELGLPCWLTFVRESGMNGDPVMPFLAPAHVTWHSAFIVMADGETHAIVGQYDKQTVEDAGAYRHGRRLRAEREAAAARLPPQPQPFAPSRSTTRPDSEVCDGLTHGMYLTLRAWLEEIGFENRLVSSERLISALRARKTGEELARMKTAIRLTEEVFGKVAAFLAPGVTERDVADMVAAHVRDNHLDLAWEAGTCPAVFTGPDTAGAHYAPTGSRGRARPHRQHGLRDQAPRLLRRSAADVLRAPRGRDGGAARRPARLRHHRPRHRAGASRPSGRASPVSRWTRWRGT